MYQCVYPDTSIETYKQRNVTLYFCILAILFTHIMHGSLLIHLEN